MWGEITYLSPNGNGKALSSQPFVSIWLLIHVEIEVDRCWWNGPQRYIVIVFANGIRHVASRQSLLWSIKSSRNYDLLCFHTYPVKPVICHLILPIYSDRPAQIRNSTSCFSRMGKLCSVYQLQTTVRVVWATGELPSRRASDANDIFSPVSLNKLLKNSRVACSLTHHDVTLINKVPCNHLLTTWSFSYRILTRNSIKYKPYNKHKVCCALFCFDLGRNSWLTNLMYLTISFTIVLMAMWQSCDGGINHSSYIGSYWLFHIPVDHYSCMPTDMGSIKSHLYIFVRITRHS